LRVHRQRLSAGARPVPRLGAPVAARCHCLTQFPDPLRCHQQGRSGSACPVVFHLADGGLAGGYGDCHRPEKGRLRQRRLHMKRRMYSGAGLLLLLLAVSACNSCSNTLLPGARLDLTEQKLYTVSAGTRKILRDLEEPVTLYFFFSERASKDLVMVRNYARRVEEMLKEYERVADGKLRLHIIDPQPFSEAEDRAAEFGLQAVPLTQTGEQLYFGLAGTNELAQREIIPFFALDQEGLLEY